MSDQPTRSLELLLAELKQLCACGEVRRGGPEDPLCIFCDAREQISEQQRVLTALDYAREPHDGEDIGMYSADYAIRIAKAWRDGKLIGADHDQITFALLREIERLAIDAQRWRFAKEQMNYSFDGENRTHYMKAEGRENFEETIDRRRNAPEQSS